MKEHPATMDDTLSKLFALYKVHYKGMYVSSLFDSFLPLICTADESKQDIITRSGVALSLGGAASVIGTKQTTTIFEFLLSFGLMDRDDSVRQLMVQAGLDIVSHQGKDNNA